MKSNLLSPIVVGFISFLFAIFLLTPVIFTFFRNPPNTVNMMVGHYYEDYYEYLSYLKQGQTGHLLLRNLFSHDDGSFYFTPWWPYATIGFLTYILHLNIPTQYLYWFASFMFIATYLILTFIAVSLLLPKEKTGIKIATFLLIIFSTSLFKVSAEGGITIIPTDFWYSIGNPLSRYSVGTPHQQIAHLVFLLGILLVIDNIRKNNLVRLTLIFISFSILLFSLSPPQLFLFWGTYLLSLLTYLIFKKRFADFIKKMIPLFAAVVLVAPLIIFLKKYALSAPAYIIPTSWDIRNLYFPPISLFLQTTGPLAFLAIFGLPFYLEKINYQKLIFLFIALLSFFITTIPISILGKNIFFILGFFNLRFNTPSSYIFLGVATVIFLKRILQKTALVYICTFMILLLYLPSLFTIWQRNIDAPMSASYLQYMPNDLYLGIKSLEKYPDDGVILTSPPSVLGVAVPALTGRKVFFGRTFFTLDLEAKDIIAKKFFALLMTREEARQFLEREEIKYILVFRSEANVLQMSNTYGLKLLSNNDQIAVLSPIL